MEKTIDNGSELSVQRSDKVDLVLQALSVDYCKKDMAMELKLKEYTKIPLTEFGTLGSAFTSIVPMLNQTAGNLYTAELSKGGQLVRAKGINGFRGFSIGKKGQIQEQAILKKVGSAGANTPLFFMSIAIMGIQHEINELKKAHTEMIEMFERDKRSQLIADMEILGEYAENFKYYWQNDATINVNLNQTKNIKRNARKNIISYSEVVKEILGGKLNTVFNYGADIKINKLVDNFTHYRLALYIYAYSTYMEIMLSQNFDQEYLNKVSHEIHDYMMDYRKVYTMCFNEIEQTSKTALGTYAVEGIVAATKFIGKQIGKIEQAKNKKVENFIIANGEMIEKKEEERLKNIREKFITCKESEIDLFYTNINMLNRFYNEPVELLWDNENLYIGTFNQQAG